MKLQSSLFKKIVKGYHIVRARESLKSAQQLAHASLKFEPRYASERGQAQAITRTILVSRPSPAPIDISKTSETFKIPRQAIEQVYTEAREIESELQKPSGKVDIINIKRRISEVEETATGNSAYIVPEIINMIGYTKEKVRNLEMVTTAGIDALSEVGKQLEDLERERKALEEAKKVIMEKYYNREIDESSIKNITDNYEQRLVEANIRIKNLKEELQKLEKEGVRKKYTPISPVQDVVATQPLEISAPKLLLKITKTKTGETKPIEAEAEMEIPPQLTQQQPTFTRTAELKRIVTTNFQGFKIPQVIKKTKATSVETEQGQAITFLSYPLIPRNPGKADPIFAYAKIFWDDASNKYVYNLVEPRLTEKLKDVYRKVKEMLEQKLDIDFSKLKKIEAKEFLDKQLNEILSYFNFTLTENEKKILKYYMARDFTGLEMIEPLMQDPNIEDISCDGIGIPLFVFHRNPDISSVATNKMFDNAEQLDSFIIRLAQLCGKSISILDPLLDGTLPDGSRIQATLGTDIARRGSNFTIRKFTEEPLTPVHLLDYGTLDTNILAYLWFVVDYGRSILVSGGAASGKTSLLNVLSLFIKPDKKIVSIEDTAELRLPHSHWVPVVARTSIGIEGKGEVDMFELLRESLRQRPDYIVVGEVRGKEAYILFQQMATGHPSLATIHAENIPRLIDRLTTPPISLPAGLISTLDIVIFLAHMKYKNKFIRKVIEIVEIADFDSTTNTPLVNQIFK